MPRRKRPKKTVTRTIHFDPAADAAIQALQELIGAPSLSYAVRFAAVEMAELGKQVRAGGKLLLLLPGDEAKTVVMTINQVKGPML
jgi:hypothetical protein